VVDALRARLRARAAAGPHAPPLRVLELGAGLGTMVQRCADWALLTRAHYTLVDSDREALSAAATELRAERRFTAENAGTGLRLADGELDLDVELVHADVFEFLASRSAEPAYDLVVANAFLDLVDVRALLPALWGVVRPGATCWFSINFDGQTLFLPEHSLDAELASLYHESMDRRVSQGRPAGDSKTGRHLLERLPESGARILAVGSSDWVVWPSAGGYPADEAYFLRHILHTVAAELSGDPRLDAAALREWVALRHSQVDAGKLVYIAHQLDVLASAPEPR
jgi:SAM-dependent methyltransferase